MDADRPSTLKRHEYAAGVALWLASGGWHLALIAGALGCICVGPQLRIWLRKRHDTGSRLIRDELWRALGIILVGHIGFGIPLAAVLQANRVPRTESCERSANIVYPRDV